MTLLCSFQDLWDNLIMAIRSTINSLVLNEIVDVILSEEVR